MSNTNLFYNLYSKSSAVAQSGYTCSSAIDESATSFDISGNAGVISDSNGNTLASIDLSLIHAEGLTQYNAETRILQPYSCCLLQGQEYGLACAAYYWLIPKALAETRGYEYYVCANFDIIYNNFTPYTFHVSTAVDGQTDVVTAIQDILDENNIEVTVSLQDLPSECDNAIYEYLVFTSQKEGYFYYINNLKLTPIFQSIDWPESPFSKELSDLKETIYDLIVKYHPMTKCDICNDDCECGCKTYDPDTYEVDCELYKWIIYNYQDLVDNLDDFYKAIDLLKTISDDMSDEEVDEILKNVNYLIEGTAYDLPIMNNYDIINMEIIADMISELKDIIGETQEYYQPMYWLIEDKCRRIPLMKYPNGAFRGIVVIPDWPTNNSEDYQYSSLWVNHVKSQVKLYRPTREHQFLPKIYGVLSNATVMSEENNWRRNVCPMFKSVQSNCACCNHIPDGWNDNLSTDYMDPYRPEHSIYEDTVYMGQNCYAHKKNIIGLFRYMQYVNDEKLWQKVGQAYMIVGNDDDPQSKDKNLPTSLIIYNPNPVTIRIKYIIFS